MKLMKKYFILAAVALTMAACSNDDGANIANDSTIRLTTGVAGTRTIDQAVQATQIVNGGKVVAEFTSSVAADAVAGWTSGNTTTTATYTADGNGNLSGATVKWPKTTAGTETVSVEAWSPFTAKPNLGTDKFEVKADQSTEANYTASDYLFGASSSAFTKADIASPILITFKHMLAKINVNVTMADGSSVLGAKVVFGPGTMKLNGTIGANSAVTVTGADATGSITMATLDANATASCIIIPQTLNNADDLIAITLGGTTYKYTLPADKTYDASKAYTYNVSISDGETIILSEQITDWTYETAESVIAK